MQKPIKSSHNSPASRGAVAVDHESGRRLPREVRKQVPGEQECKGDCEATHQFGSARPAQREIVSEALPYDPDRNPEHGENQGARGDRPRGDVATQRRQLNDLRLGYVRVVTPDQRHQNDREDG
jgi:hypothetical protein